MMGASKHIFRRKVGNGSRVHDLLGDFTMILLITSEVAESKSSRRLQRMVVRAHSSSIVGNML
jgi:hypothetical protein